MGDFAPQETFGKVQRSVQFKMPVVLRLRNDYNTFPKSFFLISHMSVLDTAIRQEKDKKGVQIEKEEEKLSLFAKNVILCIENPNDFTKKLFK